MKTKNVKVALLGLAIVGSILGLQPSIKRDFEGRVSLNGLTSTSARASVTEGHRVLNACEGQPGYYYYSCDSNSYIYCAPTTCMQM